MTAPAAPERAAPPSPPEVLPVYARFATAWSALVFAAQLPGSQIARDLECLRGGPGDRWWIRADLTLVAVREMVSVATGEIFLPSGDGLLRDRGWGDPAGQGEPLPLACLRRVRLLDLVQAAGLHPRTPRPMQEAVLLLPGYRVAEITRRALDLQLEVSYRPVMLTPLFGPDRPARSGYELRLRAADAYLPAFLISALDRDPSVLVCRRAADTLLVRHQLASPLPDGWLASLTGDATWVLADAAYGCAQLHPLGAAQDGASLVRRGDDYELTDVGPGAGWTEPGESPAGTATPELALVRARMTGVAVDAALLDDADLACVPFLLAGEPLAEAAMLIRGRDRHLVTAAGGLLEELPVGEPLYCLGPGSLYVPLGYRLQPSLPPAARQELFPADASSAVVIVPGAALRFSLAARDPIWTLWAGQTPPTDDQVPPSAAADLEALDQETTPAGLPPQPLKPAQPLVPPRRAGGKPPVRRRPRDWRDEAYEAELAGDFSTAAELHLQHNEPLRAARLYERAAELG